MNALARRFILSCALGLELSIGGCRAGGESSGDVLRRQNMELQSQVAKLQSDASELRAKLAEYVGGGSGGAGSSGGAGASAGNKSKSVEVAEATPRVASIEIDFLSGPTADSNTPPQSDRMRTVAIYIKPLDGRGRFVQATGTMSVEVSRLTELGTKPITTSPGTTISSQGANEQPAKLLASKTLQPLELRDAYRAGFTGTYYVIELPVLASDLNPPGQLMLRAHFSDGITGAAFQASRLIGLR